MYGGIANESQDGWIGWMDGKERWLYNINRVKVTDKRVSEALIIKDYW